MFACLAAEQILETVALIYFDLADFLHIFHNEHLVRKVFFQTLTAQLSSSKFSQDSSQLACQMITENYIIFFYDKVVAERSVIFFMQDHNSSSHFLTDFKI